MYKLSDTVERKFIESFDVSDWEIETDSGFKEIISSHKTIKYDVWEIKTEDGSFLRCADTHIVFNENFEEIFVKDCIPFITKIITKNGPSYVTEIHTTNKQKENMYDLTVNSYDHRFWTDNILSHNSTTTCAFILWYILFNDVKTVALLANKGDTAKEILGKVQLAYQHLPKWLQQGVVEWNKTSFVLENQSRVFAAATSSDSIRGYAINLLFIDECVLGDTKVTIRNKKTKEITQISMKELYDKFNIIDINDFEVLTEKGFRSFSGITRNIKDEYLSIKLDDNSIIECSVEHELKNIEDVFMKASDLKIGDMLYPNLKILNIELKLETVEVFDLTDVEETNSYITNNVISHNCAFVENWEEFFTSTIPTVTSGETTKVVLVSTPKGLNHFYKIWSFASQGKNEYYPIEVKWDRVPGRTAEWKKRTLETDLNYDFEKFAQEHEVSFQGSSGTLIAGWKLKELTPQPPIQKKDGLTLYESPIPNHLYVCIADVSHGKGQDYSAFHIIDVTKMPYKQVCTFHNNTTAYAEYSEIINRVSKSYNYCPVLIESNDIGAQVAAYLHDELLYEHIIYTAASGRAGYIITNGMNGAITGEKGIRTTKTVKNIGCSMLKLIIEQNQLIIQDSETISELSTFSKKGKSYEAEEGKFDDLVMPLVLFSWMTNQSFFKEYTDINTISRLREKSEDDLLEELVPFGFMDDGQINEDMFELGSPVLEDHSWVFDY
jgi:hypothetical protein